MTQPKLICRRTLPKQMIKQESSETVLTLSQTSHERTLSITLILNTRMTNVDGNYTGIVNNQLYNVCCRTDAASRLPSP